VVGRQRFAHPKRRRRPARVRALAKYEVRSSAIELKGESKSVHGAAFFLLGTPPRAALHAMIRYLMAISSPIVLGLASCDEQPQRLPCHSPARLIAFRLPRAREATIGHVWTRAH